MPQTKANFKDGQGHKDKYLDPSTKIMSQGMFLCNIKAQNLIILLWFFFNVKLMSRSKGLVPPKWSYISQGVFMWNIKTWGLTVQKLFAMLKFSENRSNSKVKGKKCWYPQKDLVTKNTYVKYQISDSHCSKAFSKVKLSF